MSRLTRPSVELGSYVVGEVPPPLEYQFLDADGNPINLTGFGTVTFQWSPYVQGQFTDPHIETASVSTPTEGRVTYAWSGAEFQLPGEYAAMFFVNDGTVQYASILLFWHVCLAVGTPPAV